MWESEFNFLSIYEVVQLLLVGVDTGVCGCL